MMWPTTRAQSHIDTRALEVAAEAKAQVRAHEDGCEFRWQQNEKKLDAVHAKIDANHSNTGEKLDKIYKFLWITVGVGLAISFLFTGPGQRFWRNITNEPPQLQQNFQTFGNRR